MEKQEQKQCDTGIGERAKMAREYLHMTQVEAAERLGIAVPTYQRCESSRANPKAAILLGFRAMGISAEWLLGGEGEMLLADRGQAAPESEDSNEVIKHRTLLFDMVVGMESQVQDSGLNPTPEQRANMILFMTDMMVDGKMPPMTPRLQKQMLKLIGR